MTDVFAKASAILLLILTLHCAGCSEKAKPASLSPDQILFQKIVGTWTAEPDGLRLSVTYFSDGTFTGSFKSTGLLYMFAVGDGTWSGTWAVKDKHLVTLTKSSTIGAFPVGSSNWSKILEITDSRLTFSDDDVWMRES